MSRAALATGLAVIAAAAIAAWQLKQVDIPLVGSGDCSPESLDDAVAPSV